ncbi:MAG TPA: hypothetical protein VGQ50_00115 [Actinomycetota bacterium]|jgi:hypothetical protein|nr:hypothetical protein [Actinomycetota bacterium]
MVVASVAVIALVVAAGIAAVATDNLVVPVPVTETVLGSIACPAPDRCIAVGSTGSRYTIRVPYAIHSAGSWQANSPTPPIENGNSFLLALSCANETHCVSVGAQEVPAPYFGAKSGGNRPLVEIWNGREWRLEKVPIPPATTDGQLSGVGCASSACMAVGSYSNKSGSERVMTEWWNGSTWKLILPPRPRTMEEPSLVSVSCSSPSSCTGVGQYTFEIGFGTLISPLILRWNGTEWRFQQSGRLGQAQDTMLNSVDCPSQNVCVTVGSQRTARAAYRSLAEVWHGNAWRVTPTIDPAHTPDADLVSVDCASPSSCLAVGYSVAGNSPVPLVEWWNGSRWTLGAAPRVPGASGSALSGVTCTAPDACIATGNYRHATPDEHAFTASWDGKRWTVTLAPEAASG